MNSVEMDNKGTEPCPLRGSKRSQVEPGNEIALLASELFAK